MEDDSELNEWLTSLGNVVQDKTGNNNNDDISAADGLKHNVIALYFGADWSPPCSSYCKQLKESFDDLVERLAPLKIIYITCDKTEDEYNRSVENLHENWFRVPLHNPIVDELINKYEIMAIPKLVIIKDNGELITTRGRKELQEKGTSAFRNWAIAANLSDWERKAVKQKTNDAKLVLKSLHALKNIKSLGANLS
ncbi:nucleoredoxin-like protein 2 [Tubulanus polymorphus]|uniref:nucleoredoxin-like protein 2 n=1 Tax=Tubulanus polymorphus TaxID=672921 RepID=UPI003DA23139